MESLNNANQLIGEYEATLAKPRPVAKGMELYTGVDLGTAYIVLAVVDAEGKPVAGAMRFAQVVRDGLVVDYVGAVGIVKELKAHLEERIGQELVCAGAAYPPGTMEGDQRAIRYVAESAGFEVETMVDEPTAANQVLGIRNGAVVDIGGGTTGIAVLQDGKVIYVADEPTGGTHFSLVVAGAYKIPFEEAERLKTDPARQQELFPVVKPVMQKVAAIIGSHIRKFPVEAVYLAGGTSCFPGIEQVVQAEVGIPTYKPENPFLVTPLGIALWVQKGQVANR
ncbi:ethanolamine utilization protein EutJ [Zhaonella formicivorans]|uniref:ethanolamine utilization protein EutJ n=1 Tax=Zhaonella formicivorans TaxID=2528593 RepID=UPI0010DE48A6|nr:ethanolamine utilization protein EutJ [Zhaonella formicivorans]